MDLKLTFNQDPKNYDRLRPRYTKLLFEAIIKYSDLDKDSSALEIGIGTGQATEPFLQTGCKVKAIEIGDQLAKYTEDKFKAYGNFTVVNQAFEDVDLPNESYDLIYAASSFHWIPLELGMAKVGNLLKPRGAFAWISNHPFYADDHLYIHQRIQKVYEAYSDHFGAITHEHKKILWQKELEDKGEKRLEAFERAGFLDVETYRYEDERTLSGEDYGDLVSTYSDVKSMPKEDRDGFLQGIVDGINECGGAYTLVDTMMVVIGRRA